MCIRDRCWVCLGATFRIVEEDGKRLVEQFRIRTKDPNVVKVDAALMDLKDSHWLNRKYAIELLGELKAANAVDAVVLPPNGINSET